VKVKKRLSVEDYIGYEEFVINRMKRDELTELFTKSRFRIDGLPYNYFVKFDTGKFLLILSYENSSGNLSHVGTNIEIPIILIALLLGRFQFDYNLVEYIDHRYNDYKSNDRTKSLVAEVLRVCEDNKEISDDLKLWAQLY
jgi:hypothetical protein